MVSNCWIIMGESIVQLVVRGIDSVCPKSPFRPTSYPVYTLFPVRKINVVSLGKIMVLGVQLDRISTFMITFLYPQFCVFPLSFLLTISKSSGHWEFQIGNAAE